MVISINTPRSKSELEMFLSPYSTIPGSRLFKRELEQYQTPTSLAAHAVWILYMKKKTASSTILDLGCGTGILSIATLLVGARRSICVDIDWDLLVVAIEFVSRNYAGLVYRLIFIMGDVVDMVFTGVDVVLMNPPFGVYRENRGLDLDFLQVAVASAGVVYSFHKYSEGLVEIIKSLASKYGFEIAWFEILDFQIPMIYSRHKRRIYRVKTLFIGLEKKVL